MRALILTVLLATSACEAASAPQPQVVALGKVDRSHAGRPGPATPFVSADARGQARTLADFRGRPVLVNLWATWCGPCVKELPALDALAGAAGAKLTVLPVSQDLEGWRAVDKFWKPGRFRTLTPRLDSKMAFGQAVGAAGLPLSILYDAEGREVWRVNGDFPWDAPETRRLLGL